MLSGLPVKGTQEVFSTLQVLVLSWLTLADMTRGIGSRTRAVLALPSDFTTSALAKSMAIRASPLMSHDPRYVPSSATNTSATYTLVDTSCESDSSCVTVGPLDQIVDPALAGVRVSR